MNGARKMNTEENGIALYLQIRSLEGKCMIVHFSIIKEVNQIFRKVNDKKYIHVKREVLR